ncbi:ABC transporter permease [Intrasporangium calvum]|uniref:Binding-protein-dependent transport systems inner membrane component n=1 Tax=Intrasporangium calvum (strain ATCC 23552 / DSM 43043 / JCM 3097 / NBRC 12989 / NCIMB 10167 / NRRL B-3866 / 7 KIP) TaxID=710696 RepID=E6S7T3_INTC7|nr:ABC transporter permease [Intrasporangium calvum]ADU47990.1 binding-protein-dependent transport systems inner membrane component [Intrasporangium calvum DSM 43043]AXG13083.1 ABC transporter permease [Intrasporangium calvum]
MLLHLVRRTAVLLASLAVSSALVFGFMVLLPGDPARVALGVNASEEAVGRLRTEFGLDRPIVEQYVSWVSGLLRLDLGRSYVSQVEIAPQILDRLQVTLWLVGCAMVLAVVVAVPVGTLMALHHRRVSGLVLSAVAQVGVAVPAFLAGILLITVFAVRLGWLPANGWTPPNEDPVQFLRQLVLPVLSLGLVQGAVLTRYVRSSVLDVQREDYIRTARAKGLGPFRALWRHGFRNAAIPVVTVLALQLSTLLIGAVVVERVFVIPGLGSLLLDQVSNRDLVFVQDIVMLLVLAVLLVNFVVDVLYVVIDPRLRVGRP